MPSEPAAGPIKGPSVLRYGIHVRLISSRIYTNTGIAEFSSSVIQFAHECLQVHNGYSYLTVVQTTALYIVSVATV